MESETEFEYEDQTTSERLRAIVLQPVPLGLLAALGLFVAIPLIQLIDSTFKPRDELQDLSMMLPPPQVLEVEVPPPPKAEEKKTDIEMEKEPPRIDLASLELALNPTAGLDSMAGFSLDLGLDQMVTDVSEMIFELEDVEEKPRPIRQIEPVYPAELRRRRVGGQVHIEFIVDQLGNVVNPRVIRTDHPDFDRPALEAIRRWKFTPGKKSGEAVKVRVRAPLVFNPK